MSRLLHLDDLLKDGEDPALSVSPPKAKSRAIRKFEKQPPLKVMPRYVVKPLSNINSVYIESTVNPEILNDLQSSKILEKASQPEQGNIESSSSKNMSKSHYGFDKDSTSSKENIQQSKDKLLSILMKLKKSSTNSASKQLESLVLKNNNSENIQNSSKNVSDLLKNQNSQADNQNWFLSKKTWPSDALVKSNTCKNNSLVYDDSLFLTYIYCGMVSSTKEHSDPSHHNNLSSPQKNWSLSSKLWPPNHIPTTSTYDPEEVKTTPLDVGYASNNCQPTLNSSNNLQEVSKNITPLESTLIEKLQLDSDQSTKMTCQSVNQAPKPNKLFERLKAVSSKVNNIDSTNQTEPEPLHSDPPSPKINSNPVTLSNEQPSLENNMTLSQNQNADPITPSESTPAWQSQSPPNTEATDNKDQPPRKRNVCYNCKCDGHSYQTCPIPLRKFCRRCGWENVIVKTCPKCTGNFGRSQIPQGYSPRQEAPRFILYMDRIMLAVVN